MTLSKPGAGMQLPPLPYQEWKESKITLHLFLQIVGKIRMTLTAPRNHWWHVPFYVTSRGITTSPIPYSGRLIEFRFDLLSHELEVTSNLDERNAIDLTSHSVASFYRAVFDSLKQLGIGVRILDMPFDFEPSIPFSKDTRHGTYDAEYVSRYFRTLAFAHLCLAEFSGRFNGKCSPVHLFWHSFDLAHTRFSGKRARVREGAGTVEADAYSHEVVSFGCWAGDDNTPAPAFYSYTHPEPRRLREMPLSPSGATWIEQGGGSLAVLPYDKVRQEKQPKRPVLDFFESAYQAGAGLNEWPIDDLRYQPPKG